MRAAVMSGVFVLIRLSLLLSLISVVSAGQLVASELKDPRTRDEDISNTEIVADYKKDSHGNYIYEYSVISDSGNLGHILSFELDISCEAPPVYPEFDPSHYPLSDMHDVSEDNLHLPVIVNAPPGQAALFGIDRSNFASWGVFLDPGQKREGLTIVSPAAPGYRQYLLIPSMDAGIEYDYSGYDETDDLPWIEDFTVYGTTIGPACPGEEGPARFVGTGMGNESDTDNALLSYSEPLQDRLTVPVGTGQVKISIHYGANLDPESFSVTPQHSAYRDLFHPEPGTSETVYLPLSQHKTRIMLRGRPVSETGARAAKPAGRSQRGHAEPAAPGMDRDIFEIRLERD